MTAPHIEARAAWAHVRAVPLSATVALVFAGLALTWDWLASVGLAPIVIAAVWCAAIAALGVHLVRRRHRAAVE